MKYEEQTEGMSPVRIEWALDEAKKNSTLGFIGFVVEAVTLLVITVMLIALDKGEQTYRQDFEIKAFLTYVLIGPCGLYFWWVWFRAARATRQLLTQHLNWTADSGDFKIPAIPAICQRYVPVIALLVVFQICFLLIAFRLPI